MVPSAKQIAFDVAVKSRNNFDYRGIADLEELRQRDSSLGTFIDKLIEIRQSFNGALAVEGQNVTGDAPHSPLYFDFIDSDLSNALAFKDANHSFIGVTVPLVFDVVNTAWALAASDPVVSGIGLSLAGDRDVLRTLLFWMLLGFVISHEYAHHVHGHLDGAFDVEEITRGSLTGNLRRQARELDADGWAAYLALAHWITASGRQAASEVLNIEDSPSEVQDDVVFACFIVAQAGFTFLREPEMLTRDTVYRRTHPPQLVRLQVMSRYVLKFSNESRPALRKTMTQARYQSLMDAVSAVMWTTGTHAAGWKAQMEFLRSADGSAYVEAVVAELDAFRATLRQLGGGGVATGTPPMS